MGGKYKPYPKYKASGIEWLGDVPEHWDVISIKRIVNIINGSTPKSDTESYWEGDIVWVTPSDLSQIENKYINSSKRRITQSGFYSCGTSLVPENSIILSTRAPIGSLAINKTILCTNQGCKSLVLKRESISLFFYYLLLISTEQLNLLGRGSTFLELSSEDLGSFSVPFPSFTEQQQIADFLDREVGKIEVLIAKQERLVELLTEKRQAVISHAVTKGLNPNTPMKPSAIDWLGDIPEHWDVISIKRIVNIINGSTPKSDTESYWEGDIVWVTPSDLSQVENKYINSSKRTITQLGFYSCGTSLVPENSIILSTRAPIGSLAINKTILCTNQGCKSLVLKRESISLFFYYLLLISTEQLNLLGRGSTFLELSSEDLGSFSVPFPSSTEQQQIAEFLDQETQKIDSLIQKSKHMVMLLKERKTALISAAVTGKIDVRNQN
ncbi:Restriction endonuclease S subunit (HsdS) (PDB:1YDX) [Commensalibacter communis]|uniref:restriction endonuclease subunit S n=1 Tax=Commensalibacter communis TaxID=2972786 RepID=UPI0022FFA2FD|nr:restriction endonuclease subunit S [Commensalibacter communis]CAI3955989.1 Restriction endonuclease S subunit (HsdS) (PDB:1YDX) [Commensalibacter communis]CAI3956772.1 Restriction endonuclease S subunit (HsdS) (PDB:1YDX) [Commensalibacter communis]